MMLRFTPQYFAAALYYARLLGAYDIFARHATPLLCDAAMISANRR